jgi:hypothetical protein
MYMVVMIAAGMQMPPRRRVLLLKLLTEEHPYNGDDATRPLNLLQLRYTYKTAPGPTRSVAPTR